MPLNHAAFKEWTPEQRFFLAGRMPGVIHSLANGE
jgi:hypothetical protein